jgi:hypothetical protein
VRLAPAESPATTMREGSYPQDSTRSVGQIRSAYVGGSASTHTRRPIAHRSIGSGTGGRGPAGSCRGHESVQRLRRRACSLDAQDGIGSRVLEHVLA